MTSEVWISPPDAFILGAAHWRDTRQDFLELFSPAAPWADVASQVRVYKVSPSLVDNAPDDVLRLIFADLQRRGVALAWEMGAVPPGNGCGAGTEGYAGDTGRSVERIKAAGGQLRFVAMDEPFWYGSYANTPHSCRLSLDALAHGVAERLDVVRAAFPDVEVGDIEPVGNSPDNGYTDRLIEWAQAFQAATRRPLAFIHADINWNGIWTRQLPALVEKARKLNLPVGAIINGDPKAGSDEGWCDAALEHEQQLFDIAGVWPEQVIFQSWDHFPTRILPEDVPGTMTNLVLRATRPPARVVLTAAKKGVYGRVTDPAGQPVARTKVEILARDVQGVGGMHVAKQSDVVPAGARTAIFALRVGVECDCSGPINASVGDMTFSSGGDAVVRRSFGHSPEPFHLTVDAGRTLSLNTPSFPIQSGAPYTVKVPLSVHEKSGRPGFVDLIFLNEKGSEIRRVPIALTAVSEVIGTTVTDTSGAFSLPSDARYDLSKALLSARVAGTHATRPTISEMAPSAK